VIVRPRKCNVSRNRSPSNSPEKKLINWRSSVSSSHCLCSRRICPLWSSAWAFLTFIHLLSMTPTLFPKLTFSQNGPSSCTPQNPDCAHQNLLDCHIENLSPVIDFQQLTQFLISMDTIEDQCQVGCRRLTITCRDPTESLFKSFIAADFHQFVSSFWRV
jgi:hypothetical protein